VDVVRVVGDLVERIRGRGLEVALVHGHRALVASSDSRYMPMR
jgi:hypothetical protein